MNQGRDKVQCAPSVDRSTQIRRGFSIAVDSVPVPERLGDVGRNGKITAHSTCAPPLRISI